MRRLNLVSWYGGKGGMLAKLSCAISLMSASIIAGVLAANAARDASHAAAPEPGYVLPVRIVEVTDGDTVIVELEPQTARVRLLDCWAPELKADDANERRKAQRAKDNLEGLASGKRGVLIVPWRRDVGQMTTLGRVLGRIVLEDGTDLSEAQVAGGYAKKSR